jgi:hypothetical protein
MRLVRVACLSSILLLCAMLCGEVAPSRASAEDRVGPAQQGQVGISTSYEIHGDTTTVLVNWQGYSDEDMVVVSLNSGFRSATQPVVLSLASKELFGVVLLRSAGSAGSATFSYKHGEFSDYFGDGEQVLSVHLTPCLEVECRAEDTSKTGSEPVTEVARLTSADCIGDFQILDGDTDSGVARIFISNVGMFPRQGTMQGTCRYILRDSAVKGFVFLDIVH